MGSETFVQVGAVVVGFDASAGVVGVDVEGIQMSADLLDGAEVLCERERDKFLGRLACWAIKPPERLTWARPAPVSRSLLSVESGLPMALLVTF